MQFTVLVDILLLEYSKRFYGVVTFDVLEFITI